MLAALPESVALEHRLEELAAAAEFDWETARKSIECVRPGMKIFRLSAKTGDGMNDYLKFLAGQLRERRSVVLK